MDSLNGFTVFVQVAETRSFVAAGRLLSVSASAIGKSVVRLEERLGVRLFHRSTRSVTLTAEGTLFLERSRRILAEIEAAELELSATRQAPRGRLRISLPLVTMLVMPALTAFMHRYPAIELDVDFSDRLVDVIEEGFDIVMRTGEPADSRLMSRPLGSYRLQLVASPGYLARRGTPEAPADLAQHACLQHKFPSTGKFEPWPLKPIEGVSEWRLPWQAWASPACYFSRFRRPPRGENWLRCWTRISCIRAASGYYGRRASTCRRSCAFLSTLWLRRCLQSRHIRPQSARSKPLN